jgi:hypothetical protein
MNAEADREPDPHGALLRAARWAETTHKPGGGLPTWTVLYRLAGEVTAGRLDVSDMPPVDGEGGKTAWFAVNRYLRERHGIDLTAEAYWVERRA